MLVVHPPAPRYMLRGVGKPQRFELRRQPGQRRAVVRGVAVVRVVRVEPGGRRGDTPPLRPDRVQFRVDRGNITQPSQDKNI